MKNILLFITIISHSYTAQNYSGDIPKQIKHTVSSINTLIKNQEELYTFINNVFFTPVSIINQEAFTNRFSLLNKNNISSILIPKHIKINEGLEKFNIFLNNPGILKIALSKAFLPPELNKKFLKNKDSLIVAIIKNYAPPLIKKKFLSLDLKSQIMTTMFISLLVGLSCRKIYKITNYFKNSKKSPYDFFKTKIFENSYFPPTIEFNNDNKENTALDNKNLLTYIEKHIIDNFFKSLKKNDTPIEKTTDTKDTNSQSLKIQLEESYQKKHKSGNFYTMSPVTHGIKYISGINKNNLILINLILFHIEYYLKNPEMIAYEINPKTNQDISQEELSSIEILNKESYIDSLFKNKVVNKKNELFLYTIYSKIKLLYSKFFFTIFHEAETYSTISNFINNFFDEPESLYPLIQLMLATENNERKTIIKNLAITPSRKTIFNI